MKLFKPVDMWLNDPRVVRHNESYYCIYGSGPYPTPKGDRHLTYRFAKSKDLITWEDAGTAIAPRNQAGWDDLSIWTPGFLYSNDTWYMYYTAISTAENGHVQRIGLARSVDLEHWTRDDYPVIKPDPQYYETDYLNSPGYGHIAWRDPAFIWHQEHQCWYGYITARTNSGPGKNRGCVALVRSKDLVNWTNMPPAYFPRTGVYFEVPQVIKLGENYILLMGDKLTGLPRVSYCVSKNPLFWPPEPPTGLLGGAAGVEYSGWAVPDDDNGYDFIHLVYDWADAAYSQRLRGYLSTPKKITLNKRNEIELKLHPKLMPNKTLQAAPKSNNNGTWRLELTSGDISHSSVAMITEEMSCGVVTLLSENEQYQIRINHDCLTVIPPTPILPERTWAVPRKEQTLRIDFIIAGRHIDVYANQRFLCTLSLRCSELQHLTFEADDGKLNSVLTLP